MASATGTRRGRGAALGKAAAGASVLVALLAGLSVQRSPAAAAACSAPAAVPVISPETDAQLSANVNRYSWDYVQRFRDPGAATITRFTGEHLTRDNAIAALTWAEHGRLAEAEEAFGRVLDQQERDPAKPAYGFFAREFGGTAIRDETLLFFISSFLIVGLERHEGDLSPALAARLRSAIVPAARIASSATLHAPATNQAMLQSFVAVRGGELSGDPNLAAAGRATWNAMYDYTRTNGFVEGNSPNYHKVSLYSLGFLVDYADDPCVVAQADEVRRMLWWSITNHYHLPLKQLAGPFSRAKADQMATILQGIHFSLYRESGGLTPEPPPAAPEDPSDEQNLHAVLSTLFAPSWPLEWVRLGLQTPTANGFQFRERTFAVPSGFAQMTSFLLPNAAIGSWSRSHNPVNGENRELIAHVTRGGEVGYLTARVIQPSPIKLRHVAAQERRNVVMAYVAETYKPGVDLNVEYTLVFRGTPGQPPLISTSSPALDETFWVDLMGTRTHVRFARYGPVAELPTLAVTPDGPDGLVVSWRSGLPTTGATSQGWNSVPTPLLAFAVRFEERAEAAVPPAAIAPIDLIREPSSYARVEWQSPDGLLTTRFQHTRSSMVQTQTFGGTTIEAVPLQSTMPPLPAPVTASFADGKLTVSSSGAAVRLACEGGMVKVNGLDPVRGALSCGEVRSVVARTGAGEDSFDLTGFPSVASSDIAAGAGNDVLVGGAGRDRLEGGPGDNVLNGGAGADVLIGGQRNDRIVSGDGAKDSVTCRLGTDTVDADTLDTVAADCEVVRRT